ncbi:excisionase [Entomomonas moraniae]|uniref:Excisionase n=1 Tax=Entomomonas moraniae TaxID=2213226 RepID=A0A3Q9JI00_9GAMM|nr:excisionase [Entomomonas moraniae]AZS49967.1 excisionase [Entomomonas moraniae]
MRVTFSEWNKNYFARPRTRQMSSNYIKEGKIFSAPIKVGREYEVDSNAILLDKELINNPMRLKERMNEQTKSRKDERFTA